ncbi:MAG: hypothetical protein ING84_05420 [Cytophagales bacterium]|nr:hypothetical protein [Cytophagales bacterium]MCA6365915.1 hypothetical protein [Cytophagales bacterium]MCA6371311.1 hypothetical protein [Cytophagales bacterium]MCA6382770.1 hypothetical protein [Cytophagales bacterium]
MKLAMGWGSRILFDKETDGTGSFGVQSSPTPIIFDVGIENSGGNRLLSKV